MPSGKPDEVASMSHVAIGEDLKEGYVDILHDFELLMIVADPECGELFPWGARGRFHIASVIRGGQNIIKDGFNSTFDDPAPNHVAYWEEILNPLSADNARYKFRMRKIKVDLKVTETEKAALQTPGYLKEWLQIATNPIYVANPRAKNYVKVRNGIHDCIIFHEGDLERITEWALEGRKKSDPEPEMKKADTDIVPCSAMSASTGEPCRNPATVEVDGKMYCAMHAKTLTTSGV